jgi:hypothetical protein
MINFLLGSFVFSLLWFFFGSNSDLKFVFFCLFVLQQCDSSGDDSVQVSQSLYNPLDEPSPLGLRLKKSPSLLDLIQMRLSQQHDSKKKDHKGSADSKLKASNFPATVLKIGTWEVRS